MLRAQYKSRGPVPQDVIESVEFPQPKLQEGEVLIELLAAPINPSDLLTITGDYGLLPPLPAISGNEGVGKIVEHGPSVDSPAIGQTVLLPVGQGTWSTQMVAAANTLMPLPNEADPVQLSMITVNPPTASLMLTEFVDLKEGDWVLQNAANSGVGNYLIQLAKMKGLKTVNIVRRESLIAPLKEQGADVVVVDSKSLQNDIAAQTDGAKIRLGIDAVGGTATGRLADCLTAGATVLNYGLMSGEPCVIPPQVLIFKDITVKGFWLATWFQQATKEQQIALYAELTKLVATGKLSAPVHGTYQIKDIKEAVATAAQGERNGKVILTS